MFMSILFIKKIGAFQLLNIVSFNLATITQKTKAKIQNITMPKIIDIMQKPLFYFYQSRIMLYTALLRLLYN